MNDNRRMNMEEFDEWQKRLLAFALKRGRACTESEWRWLKMVYDTERTRSVRAEYSLAADGETLNAILAGESAGVQRNSFHSADGKVKVEITIRPQKGLEPIVYIKMTTDDKQPIAGGKLLFPGLEREFETDDHGRLTLTYAEYLSFLQQVMFLACRSPDGDLQRLEME